MSGSNSMYSLCAVYVLVTLFWAVVTVRSQYITCGFRSQCEGFITSIDNDFNVDTDVPWRRARRLHTTNYKPKIGDHFLTIYQPPPAENPTPTVNITARVVIPAPSQPSGLGCLRIRYALENGTMYLKYFESYADRFSASSNSSQIVSGISEVLSGLRPEDTGRLLLVVKLWPGRRAEFGLDSIRMYHSNCTVVSDNDYDDEDPKWPPPTAPPRAPTLADAGVDQQPTTPGAASLSRASLGFLMIMSAAVMIPRPVS